MSDSTIIRAIAQFKSDYGVFDPSLRTGFGVGYCAAVVANQRTAKDIKSEVGAMNSNTSLADFQREYQARMQSDSKDL